MGNVCTVFLSCFPSHSQLGCKRKAAGCGFTLHFIHRDLLGSVFFPTTSATHHSWSLTHNPTSDLHLMPNGPHFIIVTRATTLQIVCQQQFVSVYSTNLGRAEENMRRGITAPRTPPLLTFIFPKPISQILTVRSKGHSWLLPMKPSLPLQTTKLFCKYTPCGKQYCDPYSFKKEFLLWALRKIAFCSKVATRQVSNWSYFGVIQASKKRKHTSPKCFDYRNLCSGSKYLRRCLEDFCESWKKSLKSTWVK